MDEFYQKLDELYRTGDLKAVETFILDAVRDAEDSVSYGTEGAEAAVAQISQLAATDVQTEDPAATTQSAATAELAALYNELASFYRGVSRYGESEDFFRRSLGIFESIGMESTPEYATVLLNLAGLHRLAGDADKSVELFLCAMKRLDDADAQDSYAYVSILNNLALAYQAKGELSQALDCANKALSIMRMGIGNEHEVASSLNNLAAMHLQLGDLDIADGEITEALQIFGRMQEPDPHHAAALTAKAVINYRKGDRSGALAGFRRASDLTKRFFGENIEYATCKRNISEVCASLGDIPSAISELSDAIRIMERILGPEHATVLDAKKRLRNYA